MCFSALHLGAPLRSLVRVMAAEGMAARMGTRSAAQCLAYLQHPTPFTPPPQPPFAPPRHLLQLWSFLFRTHTLPRYLDTHLH